MDRIEKIAKSFEKHATIITDKFGRPATAHVVAQAIVVDIFVRDSWSLQYMVDGFARTPCSPFERPGLILFAA